MSDGADALTQRAYCRPLGGAVEFGEHCTAAVAREIREELAAEIRDVRLLGVLENLFALEGQPGHEIVFVYDARFVDETLYERAAIPFHEAGWTSENARWFDLTQADEDDVRLVPEGLWEFLKEHP